MRRANRCPVMPSWRTMTPGRILPQEGFMTRVLVDPEFALDTAGFPSSFDPGQTATLGLTFHPVAAGLRTGLLKISFAGGVVPTTVSLSGTGVAPRPPGGCGCASGGGAPSVAGLLVFAFALKRRRAARAAR